jgi:2-polyprenyl-3-methyl-5-hydroxy-6-metoxy-1,4-benzoquinol methylase
MVRRSLFLMKHETISTMREVTKHRLSAQARADHWSAVHLGASEQDFSWYQSESTVSLALLSELAVDPDAALIDVGGGASNFVDQLLAQRFSDVTVLDISETALDTARRRVGSDPRVTWLVDDLLTWNSERLYDVWHDRALFHFLASGDVDTYRSMLDRALAPHGTVILATFAHEGPEQCSGLAVERYGVDELADALGASFKVVTSAKEIHRTPNGTEQAFTWVGARRRR